MHSALMRSNIFLVMSIIMIIVAIYKFSHPSKKFYEHPAAEFMEKEKEKANKEKEKAKTKKNNAGSTNQSSSGQNQTEEEKNGKKSKNGVSILLSFGLIFVSLIVFIAGNFSFVYVFDGFSYSLNLIFPPEMIASIQEIYSEKFLLTEHSYVTQVLDFISTYIIPT